MPEKGEFVSIYSVDTCSSCPERVPSIYKVSISGLIKMKTSFFLTPLFLLIFLFPLVAQAQSSRIYFVSYLGLNTDMGGSFNENATPVSGDIETKNAISLAGALGIRMTRHVRIETEFSYRRADMDRMNIPAGSFKLGGEIKTWTALINGYYDFDFGWEKLSPFVSAGLGIASHKISIDDLSGVAVDRADKDMGLAWQLGGGLKMRMNENLAFTGGYRYLDTSNIEFDVYDIDFGGHEFRLGLEYDIPVSSK